MSGGHTRPQNGGKGLSLQPMQLAAMLVLDAAIAYLQIGANQLGGFLKLEREADILVQAMNVIGNQKSALMAEWENKVQIVPASAMPSEIVQAK